MEPIFNDLRAIASARIFFGHRSVGRNVLEGLGALAAEAGVPLNIVEVTGVPPDDGAGLFHANIGQNGDPASKCDAFERLVIDGAPQYDIAALKFCYADLRTTTPLSAEALLARYAASIDNVRAARPDIQLMHVTIPLKARPEGAKARLKRAFRMTVAEDADNVLRESFNRALRGRYADAPIFDLATVESTRPDGSRSGFIHDGEFIPALEPAYTYDGGHLNTEGQRRAAIELVRTLAAVLASQSGASARAEAL
jgi:hypothetical protein